ncbi:hypothetical protein EXIGLDRAFT_730848 [Exidia glandulosa HHB12029]|uniref:Golgi apparatus membrane protein TVP38 n=1 Tax=Exidia glandulosa HHB12029 TaxID=1314781 RepID=A0A165C0K7_EXIGL|nr:hypothetical protein EXIGLDRAFT_730848 [Exidia glandulosa HHB12029]
MDQVDESADVRTRTPSPTPSELEEINAPLYDYGRWKRKETWLRWQIIPWFIFISALIAGFVMLLVESKAIVKAVQPAVVWLNDRPGNIGWLIPIAFFFVLSFPPLIGQNFVAITSGICFGTAKGFGITCGGILLGELANYYAFKHCLRGRAEKLEKNKMSYACLTRVVRDGGFKVAMIARMSALPSHFTTGVFATCGMSIWTFLLAAVLSLPKQFPLVYVGVGLATQNKDNVQATKDKNNKGLIIFSDIITVIIFIATFSALWWINRQLRRVKPAVMLDRRRARLAALRNEGTDPEMGIVEGSNAVTLESSAMDLKVPEPAPLADDRRLHVV